MLKKTSPKVFSMGSCIKKPNKNSHRRRYCLVSLGTIIIASVAVIAYLSFPKKEQLDPLDNNQIPRNRNIGKTFSEEQEKSKSAFAIPAVLKDQGKEKPMLLSPSDFEKPMSIGELNLICAQGLPGAEDLDIDKCLKTIEEWAELVRKETERCFYMYRRNPKEYYNSEAYFRMLVLITVLQKDLGVHYNMDLANISGLTIEDLKKPFTSDSRNTFIHGLLTGKKQGTCASMPTLTIAVGRLLGYPLYLACAKFHTFVRWEDENEKINFEVTNGLGIYSDDRYTEWPMGMTQEEKNAKYYLKPCSPIEEYSIFLQIRISILSANGRLSEAKKLAEAVKLLTPNCPYNDEMINGLASAEAMQRLNMARINGEKEKHRINTIAYTARIALSQANGSIHDRINTVTEAHSAVMKEKILATTIIHDRAGEEIVQYELNTQKLKNADEF
ncbi:MAG: hypothetical protein WAX69_14840 [Victivallales bacterium]